MELLRIEDLRVEFASRDAENRPRVARALNGVGFTLSKGEILGLIGETGAGKSLTMSVVMHLAHPAARVTGGRVLFEGRDLLALDEAAMRPLRGNAMSVIVQSPLSALDPLCRIGDQLVRVQRAHLRLSRRAAAVAAQGMLARVGIPDAARRMRAWPHELSGGMAQRVLIAMALLNAPRLLIADEPTTGLDATVQVQILDELRAAVAGRDMGVVLVTHHLGVVANYCDRVAVMFAGLIVETATAAALFGAPRHPYTQALIAAANGEALHGPVGAPPDLYDLPEGCLYRDRCERATAVCATRPALLGAGHAVACHHAG